MLPEEPIRELDLVWLREDAAGLKSPAHRQEGSFYYEIASPGQPYVSSQMLVIGPRDFTLNRGCLKIEQAL
ncbi:hypothetical protein N7465_001186 [Penicillium sp. CMV-2018d]|nr:hypothetical protein N7465_001186 [Penicillium sp. CMV-2018d]